MSMITTTDPATVRDLFFSEFATLAATPGGVAKLREIILQLAVQGRLVPQDPEDEPASVLLERITAEKSRLIKKGQIRKTKPLPKIVNDEIPHSIPNNWIWTKIGNIGEVGQGGTPSTKNPEYWDGEIPWLRSGDILFNRIKSAKETISETGLRNSAATLVPKGSVLLAMTGQGKTRGRAAILDIEATANQSVSHIIVENQLIIPEYLFYYFRAEYNNIRKIDKGTSIPGINTKIIKNLLLPLPPLPEQHHIVEKIDALMALCDELEARQIEQQEKHAALGTAALAALTEAEDAAAFDEAWALLCDEFDTIFDTVESVAALRQAVLQLAVQGKLVPQDPEDEPAEVLLERIKAEKERLVIEGEIKKVKQLPTIGLDEMPYEQPQGWVWVRLRELGDFCGGATPSKNRTDFWEGNVPWVSPKDMKVKYIEDTSLKISEKALDNGRLRKIPRNSILIVARSGILKRMLPVSINRIECTVNQDLKVIIPYLDTYSEYLHLMLRGHENFILNELVKGGVTVQSLKYSEFEFQPFPLPPLSEQHRIVEKVDAFMTLCDELEERIVSRQEVQGKLLESVVAEMAVLN